MLASLILCVLEGASPVVDGGTERAVDPEVLEALDSVFVKRETLAPEAALAHLFPGAFSQVLDSPDRIVVAGLVRSNERLPREASDAQFVAGWKLLLPVALRARVLKVIANGGSYSVEDPRRCAPNKSCVVNLLCGGFNPSLEVSLTKGQRTARVRVCFGCGELWVTRYVRGKTVGDEQALLADRDAWIETFSSLAREAPASSTLVH